MNGVWSGLVKMNSCFGTLGLKGHKMIFSLFSKFVYYLISYGLIGMLPQLAGFNLRTSLLISLLIMLSPVAVYASTLPQPLSGSDVAHYSAL